jgi:hypothetical protein
MSKHPVNSVVRFILELTSMTVFAWWGYLLSETGMRILPAILLPLCFAVIWGVFAVRDDPSRSGKTVVRTPGIIRLIIELALFGTATWMLLDLGHSTWAIIFGSAVILHYIFSLDRIAWLLKQK